MTPVIRADILAGNHYAVWCNAVHRYHREVARDPSSAPCAAARASWLRAETAYHAAAALAHRLRCEAAGRRHLRRVA